MCTVYRHVSSRCCNCCIGLLANIVEVLAAQCGIQRCKEERVMAYSTSRTYVRNIYQTRINSFYYYLGGILRTNSIKVESMIICTKQYRNETH